MGKLKEKCRNVLVKMHTKKIDKMEHNLDKVVNESMTDYGKQLLINGLSMAIVVGLMLYGIISALI